MFDDNYRPQMKWGGIQHALQVSRPTPREEVDGDLAGGGYPGLYPRGKLRGIWPGGGGCLQAYTQGGS